MNAAFSSSPDQCAHSLFILIVADATSYLAWRYIFCLVKLWIKHWSLSFADLQISPLRYPCIVVIPCWEIKHSSSNLKLPTLNIKIKRPKLTLFHPKASFDLWLKQLSWTLENKRNFYLHGIKLGPLKKIVWNINIIVT